MNRFPQNPYSRYRQERIFPPPFQQSLGLKGQNPSQFMDNHYNDDAISVASESTFAQNYSQENFVKIKADLCDMFKSLIEINQKNFTSLIDSVKKTNDIGLESLKLNIAEVSFTSANKLEKIPLQETQKVDSDTTEKFERINLELAELNKIVEGFGKIYKKPSGRKRKLQNYDLQLFKPAKSKKAIPCDCWMKHRGVKSRGQILRSVEDGTYKCECKKEILNSV